VSSLQDQHETDILRSWHINARPWSRAIRLGEVVSRELVTNAAILEAMATVSAALMTAYQRASPREALRILDVGCGEGWLTRELAARGMRALGIDAVPELTIEAQKLGGGEFQVLDYAAIAERQWRAAPFDAAVCNFSLLGDESVEKLVAALPWYLATGGYLIIQTLHPIAACGEQPYQDGWRTGNWCGFSGDFSDPAPGYFRTIDSWQALLKRSGFDVLECREPKAPLAILPSSIIWIGKSRGTAQT
jgi:2-polyprenyl-3-methyl-5-hydroxy-6-metoxy-1,4-benzoquinol methylase